MKEKPEPEDDTLEFEIFYCKSLEEALTHVPHEHRSRAIRKRRIIDD